jgi:hypothetical protein
MSTGHDSSCQDEIKTKRKGAGYRQALSTVRTPVQRSRAVPVPGKWQDRKKSVCSALQPNAQRLAKDETGYRQTLSTASATAHHS